MSGFDCRTAQMRLMNDDFLSKFHELMVQCFMNLMQCKTSVDRVHLGGRLVNDLVLLVFCCADLY